MNNSEGDRSIGSASQSSEKIKVEPSVSEGLINSIFGGARLALYDVLGRFIPGFVLVEGVIAFSKDNVFNTRVTSSDYSVRHWIIYLVIVFCSGFACQGLANSLIWLWRKVRKQQPKTRFKITIKPTTISVELAEAPRSEDRGLLNFASAYALFSVPEAQSHYDRFLALAEMARGLVVSTAIVSISGYVSLMSGWTRPVGFGLAILGFLDRYWRLSPLPNEIALGIFVSKTVQPLDKRGSSV